MPTEELIYDWNQIIEPDAPYPQVGLMRRSVMASSAPGRSDIESKMGSFASRRDRGPSCGRGTAGCWTAGRRRLHSLGRDDPG